MIADLGFAAAAWAVLSALAIFFIGAFSLTGGAARVVGTRRFGLFALAWGGQTLAANLTRYATSAAAAERGYLILLALSPLTTYFLVNFVAAHHIRRRPLLEWSRWLVILTTLAAIVRFIVDPASMYDGVAVADGTIFPQWGVWHAPLVVVPQFVAFGFAFVWLAALVRDAPTQRTRERYAIWLTGIGLYTGFAAANNLTFYAGAVTMGAPVDARMLTFMALFAGLTGIIATSAIRAIQAAQRAPTAAGRRIGRRLAWGFGLALTWGSLEAALALTWLPRLETVGLWRLAGGAVLAYGYARWRIYDLPERAGRVAGTLSGTTFSAAAGVGGLTITSLVLTPAAGIVVGFGVFATLVRPTTSWARGFFATPRGDEVVDQGYGRRVDAYRAALESTLARGQLENEDAFLVALRARFDISPEEHRLLLHLSRQAVILPTSGDTDAAYERLRLLGEGAGGRTWLVRDRARDRLVVMKEPRDDAGARGHVLREARALARLDHAHVVRVEAVLETPRPALIMEHVDGGTLDERLRANGTLPWREAQRITLEVLAGLAAVHARDLVHRDIKPANILLTREGHAKLGDFGLARQVVSSGRTLIMGDTPAPLGGTLAYMAPELRAHPGTADAGSDVYAAAAVLFECLHGAPPGPQSAVVVRDDVPAALTSLLSRALAPEPAKRYATAGALSRDLSAIE